MKSLIVIFSLQNLIISQYLGSTSANSRALLQQHFLERREQLKLEHLEKAEKTITDPGQFPSSFHNLYNYKNSFHRDPNHEEVAQIPKRNYHRPAVMQGGLLTAQVPRHTLIAIDRFLKILKAFAGSAILIAIGMPFLHELTLYILDSFASPL